MLDPRETYKAAEQQARHARRTGMRLLYSGIGFSAAYFLDPEHGASRRKQALQVIRRAKATLASARAVDEEPILTKAGSSVADPIANGTRAAAEGLRIAR